LGQDYGGSWNDQHIHQSLDINVRGPCRDGCIVKYHRQKKNVEARNAMQGRLRYEIVYNSFNHRFRKDHGPNGWKIDIFHSKYHIVVFLVEVRPITWSLLYIYRPVFSAQRVSLIKLNRATNYNFFHETTPLQKY
jgi:hypothetical protein